LNQYLIGSVDIWNSSNVAILAMLETGTYWALELGSVTVIAESMDSMYIHMFNIIVLERIEPIVLHDSVTLIVGEDFNLNTLLQQEVTNWYNEDPTIAGLESGIAWGIEEGRVSMSAYTDNESYVHWFHISVIEDTATTPDLIALIIEQIQLLDNHTIRIIFNRALSEADNLEDLIEILLRLIDEAPTLRSGETTTATILRALIDGDNSNALVIEIEESFSDYDEIEISIEEGNLHTSDGQSNQAYSKTFTMEELTSVVSSSYKTVIYPTITSGEVHIKTSNAIQAMEVYSSNGQKVAVFNNSTTISIDGLASGNYLLLITNADGSATTHSVILK